MPGTPGRQQVEPRAQQLGHLDRGRSGPVDLLDPDHPRGVGELAAPPPRHHDQPAPCKAQRGDSEDDTQVRQPPAQCQQRHRPDLLSG
ncbi:hypothetical protein ACFQX7_28860 [Luedemannella flava]